MKTQSLRLIAAMWTLVLLVACGGGGTVTRDEDTTTSDPDPTYSVSLALTDSSGTASSSLSADTPLTLSATVTNSSGTPVSNKVVTFSFTVENLAEFSNDTGTALTNDQGVATITLIVGELSGSGMVEAAVDNGDSAQIGFTSSGTTASVETPTSLELFASQTQLSSSGSDEVEVWAVIKNAQNILLEGIPVSFSADNNAAIVETQPTTDENGIALVMLRTGGDKERRTITVTASVSSGSASPDTVSIEVVGTAININGPQSSIIGDEVELTISLEDSDSVGIANESIIVSVLEDESQADVTEELLDTTEYVTDSSGRVSVSVTAPRSGLFILSAGSLGVNSEFELDIQQDEFSFVNPPDINDVNQDIPLDAEYTLQLEWLRDGVPFDTSASSSSVDGVEFAISRGEIVNFDSDTDENGLANISIRSEDAGIATITATGTDSTGQEVTTEIEISFIAEDAATLILDATPDSIGPDGQTSTISAIVLDATGNRVRNKLVNFVLNDVSNGNLTDAQSRTNRSGIATTVYESNAVSTYQNVIVSASVSDDPSVSDTTTLTVGDRPFDITLGTGNLIESPQASSYSKEFSVFVTDADGNPVEGAAITFSAVPVLYSEGYAYSKGDWVWNEDDSIYEKMPGEIECLTEDIDGNGMLGLNEDFNEDGELTPGNVAAIDEQVVTDENGQALLYLNYPRQFGGWVRLELTARGESSGTESIDSMIYALSVAAADLTNQASKPPASPWLDSKPCEVAP